MGREVRKWFYNSKAWRATRQQALFRDGYTCQICGARATEVHHLIELDNENIHDQNISLNLDNLQSLCHDCHARITWQQKYGRKDCDKKYYFDDDGMLQMRKEK